MVPARWWSEAAPSLPFGYETLVSRFWDTLRRTLCLVLLEYEFSLYRLKWYHRMSRDTTAQIRQEILPNTICSVFRVFFKIRLKNPLLHVSVKNSLSVKNESLSSRISVFIFFPSELCSMQSDTFRKHVDRWDSQADRWAYFSLLMSACWEKSWLSRRCFKIDHLVAQ